MTNSTYPTWVFDGSVIDDPFGYGERAVRFIRALRHPKTGRPFQLDAWMERIVRRIYGPRRHDGARVVKNVVMMIPRGARKTTLGAALSLLHAIGPERVSYGQVVLAAYDRAQARIAFDEASGIVRADNRIVAATKIVDSRHEIGHRKDGTKLKAVSADAAAQNGRTPAFVLFDEVHAWRDRKLYDVLRTGLGKTAGTLSVVISQAGRGQENVAFEIFDYARKVARGDVIDPGTLPVLFETPGDADWQDEAVWHRANPGLALGYPDLDALRQEALEAQNRPALREKFRNDHLDVWLDHSADPFVDMGLYDRGADPIDLDALKGKPCWLGVDLSKSTDLSAVVAAFRDDDGGFIVLPHFFCPGEALSARSQRDGVPYEQWRDSGFITPTPGDVIDYTFIVEHIRGLARTYQVREIAFDITYGQPVMQPLQADGLNVTTLRQGWGTQSPALVTLEGAIISGKFQHGGNPVLRSHFDDVAIHTDALANRTAHKTKSTGRIDGFYACWMAVSRAAACIGGSLYDDPLFSIEDAVW